MLDSDTKRRIDTARDILVGKVPDPKSQVEQITIALIYKFMDDMDAESVELGGKRSFFAGKFAHYGWVKLMRSGLGGHEALKLYSEAISRMPENPGIPALFRDIFKNAYLPYRDPETLRAFLKVIDEFNYDHSERLGDAFEYLLSVLGSQGDAGQFRTPRHIIDFMVKVIDPKKSETVLDPACGTAGFLISSWKHILRANVDAKGNSKLTPDERAKLALNFRGYDISPDMVRLSLVNLYLHGFADPHIAEYDTLTSLDKWNEYADVILANPPFMSPKGGIRPHNRFSVQSKRSEVLFVDYMAEHLTPKGRAAIIVPEGIIFQSQGSYKQLRKMLVESSLVAVVSLPAGVFNPYSGVKTSILFLDKDLAKKKDSIAFFKVENDGYGLGAQRREIGKNDLPEVEEGIREYFNIDGKDGQDNRKGKKSRGVLDALIARGAALVVEKGRIAEKGEYGLGGERYRETSASSKRFPHIKLGELCKPDYGFTASAAEKGNARFVRITDIGQDGRLKKEAPKYITLAAESKPYLLTKGDLLVARTGATFGKTMLFDEEYPAVFASYLIRLRFQQNLLLPEFYWAFAQTEKYWDQARSLMTGGGQPQFNGNAITQIEIPLPPLEVQKEIVAEIEVYQKVIDGARAVLDNYRPHIPIDPEWPVVELGEVVDFISGYAFKSANMTTMPLDASYRPVVKIGNVGRDGQIDMTDAQFHSFSEDLSRFALRVGDVVLAMTGATVGKVAIVKKSGLLFNQRVGVVRARPIVMQTFILHLLCSSEFYAFCQNTAGGGAQGNIAPGEILEYQIPLAPLAIQEAIVAEIEAEQSLVAANRELVERFERKVQATLGRVWGDMAAKHQRKNEKMGKTK